jgi:hypothetical protein
MKTVPGSLHRLLVSGMLAGGISTGHAQSFDAMAVISSTMGVNAGRVCMGEGSRGDLGCPSYAPYVSGNGSVGVGGLTSPRGALDVSGSILTRPLNAGSGTSIDFAGANLAYTSAACGAFTLSGMEDGGTYMLVVTGNGAGPASFSHAGLAVKAADTLDCDANTQTVFTFIRVNTNVYVTHISGF